jgi:signal transduction histidine kinase
MVMDMTRIRQAEDERDRLSEALVRAEERQRMAMDLHDGVIQQLFGASMLLQGLRRRNGALSEEAHQDALQTAVAAVESAHSIVRGYMEALRSPVVPDGSFGSLLEALAQDLRVTMGIRVEVRVSPIVENLLPPQAIGELLQIAREATANAVRHGKASELRMRARRARDQFAFIVQDDGAGFDTTSPGSAQGHGLANMAERARRFGGELHLSSVPGQGTEVRVELPLNQNAGAVKPM